MYGDRLWVAVLRDQAGAAQFLSRMVASPPNIESINEMCALPHFARYAGIIIRSCGPLERFKSESERFHSNPLGATTILAPS